VRKNNVPELLLDAIPSKTTRRKDSVAGHGESSSSTARNGSTPRPNETSTTRNSTMDPPLPPSPTTFLPEQKELIGRMLALARAIQINQQQATELGNGRQRTAPQQQESGIGRASTGRANPGNDEFVNSGAFTGKQRRLSTQRRIQEVILVIRLTLLTTFALCRSNSIIIRGLKSFFSVF
ncbi:MAG: hypothetical protein M1816_005073, partial [Peltula sp. TS41687]